MPFPQEKIPTFIKEESKEIKKKIREQMASYITAALGLVAGLAWNDAIKALIDFFFPLHKESLIAKFMYAIIMTAMVAIATLIIFKLLKKEK